MASGAAATRLKCPVPRVTSSGLHANSSAREPRFGDVSGDVSGEQERGVGGQHRHQQVDDVERGDDAEDADQRQRQKILERRVVVKAEIASAR